jgi:molybdopterin molybdotransferase
VISLEEAKERILASITPLPVEHLPLSEAAGRYCAAPLHSTIDLPRFDNSAMDGYAVRCDDLKTATSSNPIKLKLIGRIAAGETFLNTMLAGSCVRLFTGSALPPGADAVVMQEDVRAENETIFFSESVKPFENVRLTGEDIRQGSQLVSPGDRLTTTRLSLLAATGHAEVPVHHAPRIAVLASGDELVEPGQSLVPGRIYESNRMLISKLVSSIAATASILPLVSDDLEKTQRALRNAYANHDLVITTGGVSVGEFDFVKDAFTGIGGTIDHWKVAIRPGKPFVFGRLNAKYLFGLPGNPVSALVTFLLLVRPALLKLMGARDTDLPAITGELTDPVHNPGDRRHFIRCRWHAGKVTPAGRQGSHFIGSLGAANCLLDLAPASQLDAGSRVTAQLWELPEN